MNSEFKIFKLGDVATIFAGGDKPQIFSNIKNNECKIPVFANGETKDGLQGYTDKAKVNEPAVTVSARGTIGYAVLRKEPFVPIVRLLTLIPNSERLEVSFLYYYLTLYRQKGLGSSQAQLIAPELSNRTITTPSLHTQKSIAKVLSDLDAKIELNNQINSELEAMAKTLYDYWFVQFDFPNEQGKPYKSSGGKMVYNLGLKRNIPDGWEVGNLEEIGTIFGGSTPSKEKSEYFSCGESTPWITPKDLSMNKGNKFITRGDFDVTEIGIKNASLKIMPKGTVLLSSRAPIGYLAISRGKVTTNQGFKSFVPDKGFSTHFIFYTVQKMIPTIINNAVGSTFKEVSGTTLKSIKIPIPVKSILEIFDKKVSSIFIRQDLLELENQQLSELRDWLLPMLMNGQVTVKEVEERLSMAAEQSVEYNKR
ncbi:MAG: restriction endonuclease subunit S [Bacteroidia bacterium]|nr:restriction endonuclease subunit S [Bacteroidia bacterium]